MACGDIGGGTGSNLEFFGDHLDHFSKVVVLDLCEALCNTARKGSSPKDGAILLISSAVTLVIWVPRTTQSSTVDVVTFSYALSMILTGEAIKNVGY